MTGKSEFFIAFYKNEVYVGDVYLYKTCVYLYKLTFQVFDYEVFHFATYIPAISNFLVLFNLNYNIAE